ncbi:3'(2'),5'-bisphosphate nucleotidase CysQ [Sandarakinorhabdus sp.]|uniref:3'(2'),5'-bisphosphate nucleotidase CysQ n=1 Tax=Sandarakinorhabdus sp. TaxID=1916663 RepID=UPI00286E2071|nr:3'(2'),5'-bisphosphate nucleotidase CysQ [Sandarakinorhabdus sp.]
MADDLALAVKLATEAGAIAMGHFHGASDWWDKDCGTPVSAGDLAVDAFLKNALAMARPGDGWLSEETADSPDRLARRRVWVVDPIDGTRDFIRGRTGWAVSVALVEDGAVTVAALAAPARDMIFGGSLGGGATGNGCALAVSGLATLPGVRLPIDVANMAASFWPEPWPGVAVEKPNSLALRMAKLAANEADVWMEGRTVAEWDVAAASLIVTEAGGIVTDRHGAALRFNQPQPLVHGLAVATPALHAEALARLDHAMKTLSARRHAKDGR